MAPIGSVRNTGGIPVTDPKGLQTTYTLNGHGDVLTQVSPDTGTTTFTYDAAGNAATKLDARGIQVTNTYDALNRLSTSVYPDETVTYTYDACTNGLGRLCSITDKAGTTSYAYDLKGRVTGKTQVVGGVTQAMAYQYNAAGQLSQVTTPSSTVIAYAYANGRPASVTVNGQTLLDMVEHEPFGPIGGWRWGNSTTATPNFHTRLHDKDFRATRVLSDRPLASGVAAIDKTIGWHAGLDVISTMTDNGMPALNATYSYDALNRIELAAQGGNTWGYTLDGVGNRLTTTQNAAATSYSYATGTHRLQALSGATVKSYTVDAAGNMTSDGQSTWTYGGNNRPTQFVVGASTTAVSINALGQRVRKGNTWFVYDEQGRLQGEYGLDGSLVQETVWLDNLPVGVIKPSAKGDFSGEGKADILWRHATRGDVYLMKIDGFNIAGGAQIYVEPANPWRIVAHTDVDGDGRHDIVWWNNSNGLVFVMLMDGLTIKEDDYVTGMGGLDWRIVGTGDFNGDGKSDLVWWNNVTGAVKFGFMNGLSVPTYATGMTMPSLAWKLAATGDFNGDRKADLVWRNDTTGELWMELFNGAPSISFISFYTEPNTNWKVLGAADFDGDGKADILWRNAATGDVFMFLMNGSTIVSQGTIYSEPTLAWKIVHLADFNGDGKADILWQNDSNGYVFMHKMNGLGIVAGQHIYSEADTNWKIVPYQDSLGVGKSAVAGTQKSGFGMGLSGKAPAAKLAAVYKSLHYVHPDHLGTPRSVTRHSDNVEVWRWSNTEPFGVNLPNENPSQLGNFVYNLRFPGQYYDSETGKHYNYFRDYDPRIGRYSESDPIGLGGGLSTYGYVDGNPLSAVDPAGLLTLPGAIFIIGGAAGAIGLYIGYDNLDKCVKLCKVGCENIKACGDKERDFFLEQNQARCINACRPDCLFDMIKIGKKGPKGPKPPKHPERFLD